MENYKEILNSDIVYKKYKDMIPVSTISLEEVLKKLDVYYLIIKDESNTGNLLLKQYNEFYKKSKKVTDVQGKIYFVQPRIPNIFTNIPHAYLYLESQYGYFHLDSPYINFANRITNEFIILKGLTNDELNNRNLVYYYVDVLKNYYLD